MHSKTCPMLNKLKDKMNRKISQSQLDATTRYDLHTRLEGMPKHNKLCHGDFNPSNIIIAEDGTPDEAIEILIRQRAEAKKAKNFAEADRLRDELKAQGVEVIDIAGGAKWKRV